MEILYYGFAHIFTNGHIISTTAKEKEYVGNYCIKCGGEIINRCKTCKTDIQGAACIMDEINPELEFFLGNFKRPSFCIYCGSAFPWTKNIQDAAIEVIEFSSSLSLEEKEDFKSSLKDLFGDTPRTELASLKFKKYSAKAGKEVANALRDIIVDVASEAVKKVIFT